MFLATADKPKRLLLLTFHGHVNNDELRQGGKDMVELLKDLPAGLRVLGDMERLEAMNPDCADQLGKHMELLDAHGVELIVRLLPDPRKDIGLNILSGFHYRTRPRILACKTMLEAVKALGL